MHSLHFDQNDLFPLLKAEEKSYSAEQMHSQQVDQWLGLQTHETEKVISQKYAHTEKQNAQGMPTQYWVDLPVQALLTPYTEIREVLEKLNPQTGQTIIDLGAGYGRMGFVVDRHFAEAYFIGYEVIKERVDEGARVLKKHGCKNSTLLQQDLMDPHFTLPDADFYFLYDFGSRQAIQKILVTLQQKAQHQHITIVGRGRSSRDAIERGHPWLSQVNKPEHTEHYSLYRS